MSLVNYIVSQTKQGNSVLVSNPDGKLDNSWGIGIEPQVTKSFYVDGNRTDSYTENGCITKPYKTIMGAISKIITNGDNSASAGYRINIVAGTYDETIVLESDKLVNLHLQGEGNRVTKIKPTTGHSLRSKIDNDNLVTLHINDIMFEQGTFEIEGMSNATACGNDFVFESCFWTVSAPVIFKNINSPNIAGYYEIYHLKYSNVACPSIDGEAGVKAPGSLIIETDNAANKPSGWWGDGLGTYLIICSTVIIPEVEWNLLNGGKANIQLREGARFQISGNHVIPANATILAYNSTLRGNYTIDAGGTLDLRSGSFVTGTITNNGILNLTQPASQINNNSTITGDTVKDALDSIKSFMYGNTIIIDYIFTKDTPSGTVIGTIPAGSLVDKTQMRITTGFDSVGANLQIGSDADHTLLFNGMNNLLTNEQNHSIDNMELINSETEIKLFLDIGGATAGAGMILILYK